VSNDFKNKALQHALSRLYPNDPHPSEPHPTDRGGEGEP
jgi:hypothetical protein